ncbi:MAG: glycosyltransferase [Armatimonadetes bacterium]|nr:glycosyltransferase [Armatimonadota bacterium]
MARVTVLVPSYNHARFLPACLGSVQAQTFQDWKLILRDDCSQDDSLEVAKGFAREDPRIRVEVNDRNLGTYGTQALALQDKDSEFVAVLNSDDHWSPGKLAAQVAAMDAHPEAPFSFVLGWKSDETGEPDLTDDVHRDWPTEPVTDVLPFLLHENRILASGVLFRQGFASFEPSMRYSGDWAALLRACYGKRAACVPERLTYWRMHGVNTSTRNPRQALEEARIRQAILENERRWFASGSDPALVRKRLTLGTMDLLSIFVYLGDMAGARRVAPSLVRIGKASAPALKRALYAWMPLAKARRRLWGEPSLEVPAQRCVLEPLDLSQVIVPT